MRPSNVAFVGLIAVTALVLAGLDAVASPPSAAQAGKEKQSRPQLAAVLSPAGSPGELTPTAYAGQLSEVSGALNHANIGLAQHCLVPILRVSVRDPTTGQLYLVDNRTLMLSLDRAATPGGPKSTASVSKEIEALKGRVALLQQDSASLSASNAAGRSAATEARSILSSSEFSSIPAEAPSATEFKLQQFTDWLKALLKRLRPKGMPSIPDISVDPDVPKVILLVVATVAVGVLIAYLIGFLSRRRSDRSTRSAAEGSSLALTAEEEELVASRDSDRLMQAARLKAEQSDYRGAFRLVFLAMLVRLDADGFVRLYSSNTNWEYLRLVQKAGHDKLFELILPVTRSFDRIWYGHEVASEQDYEVAVRQYSALKQQSQEQTEFKVSLPREL